MSSIERALQANLKALRRRRLAPVQVAVVDSGIDATHPALRGRVAGAWRVVQRGKAVRVVKVRRPRNNDVFGHGTAAGGIVAAIAPNARLLDIRVLDERNLGSGPALLAGFGQAIATGARLINLSLACVAQYAPQLHELCERAYRRSQIVVAARRNMPLADNGFPAEFSSCISVALGDFHAVQAGLPRPAAHRVRRAGCGGGRAGRGRRLHARDRHQLRHAHGRGAVRPARWGLPRPEAFRVEDAPQGVRPPPKSLKRVLPPILVALPSSPALSVSSPLVIQTGALAIRTLLWPRMPVCITFPLSGLI